MLALEQTDAAGPILESLPNRIHHVFESYVAMTPDSLAVIGDSERLTEIEAVISSHPAVVQSAVVGRQVPGNEEVVAFVQLLKGVNITAQDLMISYCAAAHLYKRPSEIILMDACPRRRRASF